MRGKGCQVIISLSVIVLPIHAEKKNFSILFFTAQNSRSISTSVLQRIKAQYYTKDLIS